MASGCPVVVSNIGSLYEICGDAAYYVEPYDSKSIAEGMRTVLTDSTVRQEIVHKGFQRVKLFNWDESAHKHIMMIKELFHAGK